MRARARMGRKLDALLRRNFKTSKFKTTLGLAISRLAVLKNQRQVRSSHARDDTAQLLRLGHQERALLRVEHVIREQNMLDVFVMIEGYCNILIERAVLIENQKDCPHELHEAISSLIFAASRSGELPEVQEVREMIGSRYGKDFTDSAVELRNNCGVNTKMIQKMSTRQPPLEIRFKVLKEIAAENGITLTLEEPSTETKAEELNSSHHAKPVRAAEVGATSENSVKSTNDDDAVRLPRLDQDEQLSGSMKTRKKYADVASAAQAAFESAAFAAAAARAAVELSRTESGDQGSSHGGSPGPQSRNRPEWNRDHGPLRSRSGLGNSPIADDADQFTDQLSFEKVHPIQYSSSESETEEPLAKGVDVIQEEIKGKSKGLVERLASGSGFDSRSATSEEAKIRPIQFDESDSDEFENELGQDPIKNKEFYFHQEVVMNKETNRSSPMTTQSPNSRRKAGPGFRTTRQFNAVTDEDPDENESVKLDYLYSKKSPIEAKGGSFGPSNEQTDRVGFRKGNTPMAYEADRKGRMSTAYSKPEKELGLKRLNLETKPVSVRTRRGL